MSFVGPEEVNVVDVGTPDPGPTEVLVETTVSAVSAGTELLVYHGDVDAETAADETLPGLSGDLSYPLRYGYAVVGTVVEAGDAVDDRWLGERVFGYNPHESHFLAEPEHLLPVPDGIAPETAALFANTETAVNFLLDGAPRIGERVAVFGQGVVGLLTTGLCAAADLDSLVAVEPHADRRAVATALGADATVDPTATADPVTAVREASGSPERLVESDDPVPGVDLAVEVSGRPETLETAVEATRYDGRVLVGSWYGTKRAEIGLGDHYHRGRIAVESSQVSTIAPELRGRWDRERRRETAWKRLRRLETRRDITDRLVTDTIPVSEAGRAYDRLTHEPESTLQVLLTY